MKKLIPLKAILITASVVLLKTAITLAQTNTFPATGSAGIGTTAPNGSALLDIVSTDKGVLVPRMTLAQRNLIPGPVTGLLIYQTNSSPGFYYYTGTAWTALKPAGLNRTLNNLTAPTAANAEILPGADGTLNIGSAANSWRDIFLDGTLFLDGTKFLDNAGTNNTFVGNTGNTTNFGSNNTFIGAEAGRSNTNGFQNVAVGFNALRNNTQGVANTALGIDALLANNTGNFNTALGFLALRLNTTGQNNTATGIEALVFNTTGTRNTASGDESLYSNTTGNRNTAYGFHSLHANTTGSSNTAVGDSANVGANNLVNATALGSHALVTASNRLVLGSIAGVNGATSSVNVGVGTTNPAADLEVSKPDSSTMRITCATTGQAQLQLKRAGTNARDWRIKAFGNLIIGSSTDDLTSVTDHFVFSASSFTPAVTNTMALGNSTGRWTEVFAINGTINTSDLRDKKDIVPLNYGMSEIMKLNPVSFKWKEGDDDTKLGLIAQELKTVLPEVVRDWEWNNDPEAGAVRQKVPASRLGVFYSDLIPVLIKGMQEQQQTIQAKTEELNSVKAQLALLNDKMNAMDQSLSACCMNHRQENSGEPAMDVPKLEQNHPNPFTAGTVIKFYIPADAGNGMIKIYALDGSEIKSIPVSAKGFGSTAIDGNTLSAGTYTYMLLLDGAVVDTKQMVLTK